MKTAKLLFLIALVGLGIRTVHAQSADFTLGAKAGVTYGTLPTNFNEITQEGGKAGFNVGVFARMGHDFYFQPEINYSSFGSEYTVSSRTYNPTFRQLTVPLMVGYKLMNAEELNFRVSVGPELSYTLNDPETLPGTDYKKFTLGGVLNAGVDVGKLTLDARYSRGFTNAHETLDQKTSVFSLSVGYRFF